MANKKKKQTKKDMYFFNSPGCVYCAKLEPIVDDLNNEGHNILKLDISDPDNKGLKEEIQAKYQKQCGTPFFVDPETGNSICGYRDKETILKWLDGEDIPAPPQPNGQMPRPPLNNASDDETSKWVKEYDKWYDENQHLPNLKTSKEILSQPRPNSVPPPPPNPNATDVELQTWKDKYEIWHKENKHLPQLKSADEILELFKQRQSQFQQQKNVQRPPDDSLLEITLLRKEVIELKKQLDAVIKHFNVPYTPTWKKEQQIKEQDKKNKG